MYDLSYFKENDESKVLDFVKQHPFAFLIGCNSENKPEATQVPLFIDERDGKLYLTGHIMRKTGHHLALTNNPNVLVVFTGPHTYVSASWYTNPQTASTWNYMSVHARGVLKFLDEAVLLEVLNRTTTHFENNPDSPASFKKLPNEYVSKMIKAIIAFEIEVTEIDNVFKLSQNRDEESKGKIVAELRSKEDEDSRSIADEVEKRMIK